ncbi:hypothetical protein ACJX0J_039628, partial [Zea mays]
SNLKYYSCANRKKHGQELVVLLQPAVWVSIQDNKAQYQIPYNSIIIYTLVNIQDELGDLVAILGNYIFLYDIIVKMLSLLQRMVYCLLNHIFLLFSRSNKLIILHTFDITCCMVNLMMFHTVTIKIILQIQKHRTRPNWLRQGGIE